MSSADMDRRLAEDWSTITVNYCWVRGDAAHSSGLAR